MSNSTLQKPTAKRRARTNAATTSTVKRQTARVEGLRDGKPLIFGWGRHLTRKQKNTIRERGAWTFAGVVAVAIVAVFVFGIIQQNLIIPNQQIVRVGSVSITQDVYRKQLAYEAQSLWNSIQNNYSKLTQLSSKAASGDATASTEAQALQATIQSDEGNYNESSITTVTMDKLIEDQLIQQSIRTDFAKDAAKLTPTKAAIDAKLKAFKAAFPANEKYSDFLAKNNISEADVRNALAVQVRRDLLQQYLADHLVSPAKQAHLRKIETNTAADAAKIRAQLVKDSSDTNWTTLAKQDSLDSNTKNFGGDMGWVFAGQGDAVIEQWALNSGAKVSDISPVLADVGGTFDVVQLLGIDENRAIPDTQLSRAKSGALDHFLAGAKHMPPGRISATNQNMLTDGRNLPMLPDLNATLPSVQANPNSGAGATLP